MPQIAPGVNLRQEIWREPGMTSQGYDSKQVVKIKQVKQRVALSSCGICPHSLSILNAVPKGYSNGADVNVLEC